MMENLIDYSGGSSRTSKSSIGSNSPIPYFYRTGDENSPASRIPPSAKLRNSFSASTTNSPGGLFGSAYAAPDDFAGEIDLAVLRRAAGTRLALPAGKSLFLPTEPKRVPRSPLSPIENLLPPSPPLFKVKAAAAHVGGEGVLVMDGVLLEEHPASGGSAKTRSGSRSSGSTTDSTASFTTDCTRRIFVDLGKCWGHADTAPIVNLLTGKKSCGSLAGPSRGTNQIMRW